MSNTKKQTKKPNTTASKRSAAASRRERKPANDPRQARLILLTGTLTAILFILYLTREIFIAAPFLEIFLGCLVLIVTFTAIAIRRFCGRVIQHILSFGLCFFLATFALFQAYSIFGYLGTPETDAVVVMGCQVYGWEPSQTLQGRLDRAVEVLEKNPDTVCVVSGGKGSNERYPEAEVMKKYLTDKGIDPSRILVEDKAVNSEENIRFSRTVLTDNGYGDASVTVVSSAYHLPRSQILAALEGYGYVRGCGAGGFHPYAWITESTREYMALWRCAVLALFR